jgi:hypothetical protein
LLIGTIFPLDDEHKSSMAALTSGGSGVRGRLGPRSSGEGERPQLTAKNQLNY